MFVNLGIAIFLFYLLAFPVRLDIVYNEPFPVYPDVVKKGEELTWVVEFSKSNNYPAILNRNILCADGNLVTLAPLETNVPPTERNKAIFSINIPEKSSLGECYLSVTATYHINPIRTIQRTYVTEVFTVIK
jgi:hypothetical protein